MQKVSKPFNLEYSTCARYSVLIVICLFLVLYFLGKILPGGRIISKKKSHFESTFSLSFFQGNPGERGFPGPGGPSGSSVSTEEYLVLFSLILI